MFFYLIQLTQGKAEVFGTELAPDKPYLFFSGAKVAVYTWHGCALKLNGNTEGTYIAKETPMVSKFIVVIVISIIIDVVFIFIIFWPIHHPLLWRVVQ